MAKKAAWAPLRKVNKTKLLQTPFLARDVLALSRQPLSPPEVYVNLKNSTSRFESPRRYENMHIFFFIFHFLLLLLLFFYGLIWRRLLRVVYIFWGKFGLRHQLNFDEHLHYNSVTCVRYPLYIGSFRVKVCIFSYISLSFPRCCCFVTLFFLLFLFFARRLHTTASPLMLRDFRG